MAADQSGEILVTGAGGAIGRMLAGALAERNLPVVAQLRSGATSPPELQRCLRTVSADVRDPASLRAAMRGVQTVVHLAAIHGNAATSDTDYIEVNVRGAVNAVAAARDCGVTRFVHISSIGVHGDARGQALHENSPIAPRDIYTRSKAEGEQAVRESLQKGGIEGVVLRPLGIYGPGDLRFKKLFKGLARGKFPMIGAGNAITQMCYTETFVEAVLAAVRLPAAAGEVFIVADEERPTVREFVALAAAATGGRTLPFQIPLGPAMFAAQACEALCKPLGIAPPLYPRRLEFYTTSRIADVSKMRRVLGVRSSLSLSARVQRTADWYRSAGLL